MPKIRRYESLFPQTSTTHATTRRPLLSPDAAASSGRLFPRFVGRVAGLPASSLEALRALRTVEGHAELGGINREIDGLRERLTALLHAEIEGLEDRQLRRRLLQLKRDIHNRRPLRGRRLDELAGDLAADLRQELRRYHDLMRRERELEGELREVFDRELAEIRHRFQTLVSAEDFQNGLLLSSPILSSQLPRYVQTRADRPTSKIRQVERSLMRYYSRAVMKPTPFSTFCALVPGTFSAASQNGTGPFTADPSGKRGVLRLNKVLYVTILKHLLRRPAVRRSFDVELNPTLREAGDGRWLFLSAAGGQEIFQRLPRNEVLDELRQRLDERPRALGELIDALVSDPEIDTDEEEAASYLDRLLEIGFMRFRVGIREQEVDWDRPLAQILDAVDDEHARVLGGFLGRLRIAMEEYAAAAPARRRTILAATQAEVATLDQRLEIELVPERKPIFYEDAGGLAGMILDPGELEAILVEFVALTSRIAWPRADQAGMRHFFDGHYGPEHPPVPLLEFYEDFYRQHFKAHLERQQQMPAAAGASEGEEGAASERADDYDRKDPFGLEIVRRIHAGRRALTDRLRELWRQAPAAEEIRLERRDLETAVAAVPEESVPCRSASMFVHWVPGSRAGEEDALVGATSLVGYGKYFSRFLSVLPDELRRDLIANNRRLTDQVLAEICGDAAHNANLHPPLLPREISYPTGESGTAEEQIPSSEIAVGRDPLDPHRLRLEHRETGQGIVPVDLGFLNPLMRPPLFQLLSRFTPSATFQPAIPEVPEPADDKHRETDRPEPGVSYRPRITYRGRLILARRQWRVPFGLFPARGKKELEADYFLRVERWRTELGLPQEVFLRVTPLAAVRPRGPQTAEKAPPLRQHLYKPQYVDFRNPLLVDLFSRAAENLDNAMFTFEERLPRGDQLLASDGARWATELVVQVDFPQAAAGRPGQEGS